MSRVSGGWLGGAGREGRKRLWDNEPLAFTVVKESPEFVTLTTSCLTILYTPFLSHPALVMWVNPPSSQEGGRRCMVGVMDGVVWEKRTGRWGVSLPLEITGVMMRKDSSWLRSRSLDGRGLVSNKLGTEGLPCGVDRASCSYKDFYFFFLKQWRPSSARREWWDGRNGVFVTSQRRMQESRGSTSKEADVSWHFRDQLVAVAFYQASRVTAKNTLDSCLWWRLTLGKTLQVRKPFQVKKWNIPQVKDCSGYISSLCEFLARICKCIVWKLFKYPFAAWNTSCNNGETNWMTEKQTLK